jgi:hypothetical protein
MKKASSMQSRRTSSERREVGAHVQNFEDTIKVSN